VLSNVSLRNFVLQVFAASLFLYIICKSIRELVLDTNCIYCVFSAFSVNILVVNHLFFIMEDFVSTISKICWVEASNNYSSIIRI
jgi:hypothetical protein